MWKTLKSHPWWIAFSVAVLVLAGWLIYSTFLAKPETPPLITAAVQRGDLEDSVLAAGTIQASNLVNVGAQVSGQVQKLYVKVGDQVQVGQRIADIDAVTQRNNLRDAEAAVASARAQKVAKQAVLDKAQTEYNRQKYMYDRDAASKADYDAARQALTTARADLNSADATIAQYNVRVQTAQANVGYTRITSPSAGTVVAIVTDEGQTVNANQTAPTIVKVAQLDTMTIQAQISEADVPRVQPGMPAYFTILGEPDKRYSASLRSIEPGPIDMETYGGSATSSSNTSAVYYNGLLDAPNPDGKLRIQMTAQVSIVLAEAKNALLVPAGALGKREPGSKEPVYTVRVASGEKGKETIEQRKVRVGLNNRVQAEVLDGLKEGELVVVGDSSAGGATSPARRTPRMF